MVPQAEGPSQHTFSYSATHSLWLLTHKWYPWKIKSSILMFMELVKLRPTPIQTDPKSKTSNVWARREKSDDEDFRKSPGEGSGQKAGFLLPWEWAAASPARGSSWPWAISASHQRHTQPISPCLASLPGTPNGLCWDALVVLLCT